MLIFDSLIDMVIGLGGYRLFDGSTVDWEKLFEHSHTCKTTLSCNNSYKRKTPGKERDPCEERTPNSNQGMYEVYVLLEQAMNPLNQAAAATPTTTPKARGRPKEDKVEKMEVDEKEEEKEEVPQVATVAEKKPVPVDLPEEELKKLAGKTVKKGEDEYVIVVQGVETGLCGKYWGDLDNLPSR